ncbi:MAG: Asp23/Gls24 family envelope stress response protein [Candidatus Dormibacteria bacterium]
MTEVLAHHSEGRIKVANEVIAQIAALTALQVSGVAGVSDRSSGIQRAIRRGGLHKGVRVELVSVDDLRLQLFLVADSGRNLPNLASEIQGKVVSAVERMLGLRTSSVDVFFADVRFSDGAG